MLTKQLYSVIAFPAYETTINMFIKFWNFSLFISADEARLELCLISAI